MYADSTAEILACALALDFLVGEPPSRLHPVVWIGAVVTLLRRIAPARGAWRQLSWGAVVGLVIPLAVGLGVHKCLAVLPGAAAFVVAVFVLKASFAVKGLGKAALQVRDALERDNLVCARRGLRSLCSRNSAQLNRQEVTAAAVASVAENTCDSFVAPMCFFVLFGVPGAMAYRAINTLDSMLGYRGDYEYLGKVSARLDDIVNWAPARVTAALFAVAGIVMRADVTRGVRVACRDRKNTASPNAGWSMAMMAGLLGIQLEKAGHYRLGDPQETIVPVLIERAWHIALLAMLMVSTAIVGGHYVT